MGDFLHKIEGVISTGTTDKTLLCDEPFIVSSTADVS